MTDGFCTVGRPIYVDRTVQGTDEFRKRVAQARQDTEALDTVLASVTDVLTDETARQILLSNETGARLCGW